MELDIIHLLTDAINILSYSRCLNLWGALVEPRTRLNWSWNDECDPYLWVRQPIRICFAPIISLESRRERCVHITNNVQHTPIRCWIEREREALPINIDTHEDFFLSMTSTDVNHTYKIQLTYVPQIWLNNDRYWFSQSVQSERIRRDARASVRNTQWCTPHQYLRADGRTPCRRRYDRICVNWMRRQYARAINPRTDWHTDTAPRVLPGK